MALPNSRFNKREGGRHMLIVNIVEYTNLSYWNESCPRFEPWGFPFHSKRWGLFPPRPLTRLIYSSTKISLCKFRIIRQRTLVKQIQPAILGLTWLLIRNQNLGKLILYYWKNINILNDVSYDYRCSEFQCIYLLPYG